MGASYLSRPVKTKVSEDHENKKLVYGVSSMQGWRIKQEDAHTCMLDFDDETSLFGVYDGHGGSEVAIYTSEKLPGFIKDAEDYKKGNYSEALTSAFLTFDGTLPSKDAITRLKEIVSADKSDDEEEAEESNAIVFAERPQCSHSNENGDDEDDADYEYGDVGDPETETPDSLRRDACRPLEEVMASYQIPNVAKLISGERGMKPASPYLRGRRDGAGGSGECSSSLSGQCSSSFVQAGKSSANECSSSSSTDVVEKMDTNGSGDAKSKSPVNGDAKESSSSAIPKEQSEEVSESTKCSKDESHTNKPSGEALVNGSSNSVNGDVTEEPKIQLKEEVKICEKPNKESPSKSEDKPSCSTPSKKKKLALTDLDDSDVVKNFITKEEISDDDEDDSEDETFQLDDGVENDSEDEDDDVEVGESLLSKLKRRLCQAAIAAAEEDDDDDDDDDDDEEHVPTSSEPIDEEDEDEGDAEEGEEEEDSFESSGEEEDDEEDSAISLFSDESNSPGVDSGCTAVVALIKNNNLYVANAGDSRCVVCKGGEAVDMSEDHKPEDEPERQRIEKAGGKVTPDGRVNGGLNLSRAIGDHDYKRNTDLSNTEQMIIALPEVRVTKLEPNVEFIVLACDGIWNSMTSQEVVDFIRPKIQAGQKLSNICEELFEKCLAPDTVGDGTGCDNMTCIIVKPLHDGNDNFEKVEIDAKTSTTTSSVKVDSTPITDKAEVVSSHSEDDKNNEAVPTAKGTESQVTTENEKAVSDASLSSTSQKRCADSTEDDQCQTKRQKTDQNDNSS